MLTLLCVLCLYFCKLDVMLAFSSASSSSKKNVASFGMGCFWEPQQYWQNIDGIIDVKVGYCGGETSQKNPPTYKEVCSGTTNHVETVLIEYDEKRISYKDLLYKFYNYKGELLSNVGQYSAVIFTHDDNQKNILKDVIEDLEQRGNNRINIAMIKEASIFYPAERYHDSFWKKQNLRNSLLALSLLSQYLPLPSSINGDIKAFAGIVPIGYVLLFLFERFIEPRDNPIIP